MQNWKGNNMVEWKKLVDIANILYGYPFESSLFSEDDSFIPLIRIRDVKPAKASTFYSGDIIDSYIIKKGDILVGMDGEFNIEKWNDRDGLLNQRVLKMSGKDHLCESGYLYHYMGPVFKKIEKETAGGSVKHLSAKVVNSIKIPIPSLSEQNRIVGILDTFTAIIENLKQEIAERRKQYEYYRDRLLDLEGKDIKETLSFGNDFFLKARIGWQGLTKKEYALTGEYKLVTGTDFTKNLRIDFDSCVFVDKERYEQDEYIKLRVGDVLITKDGTLGKVAYIDDLEMPATLNGGVFVVRDPRNKVLPKFLMYYLTSDHFKKWMKQNHTTGSIQHLTQKLLSGFTIPVFTKPEQSRIVSILDTFEASISNLEAQLEQREKQYEYYRNKLLTFE